MKQFLHSRRLTVFLVIVDALVFTIAWVCTYWLRDALAEWGTVDRPINDLRNYLGALCVYLPLWLGCGWYYGLYDHEQKLSSLSQATSVLKTCLLGALLSLAAAYLLKPWDLGRFILLVTPIVFFVYLGVSRSLLRQWKKRLARAGTGVLRVAVIGVSRTARRVAERISANPLGGYQLAGFVDPYRRLRVREIDGIPVLGTTRHLVKILKRENVDIVFLAVPHLNQNEVMALVVQCEHLGVQFKIASNLFEVITSRVKIDVIDEMPVVSLRNDHLHPVACWVKRLMDIAISLSLLVLSSPLMLILAVLIKLDSRGPVLFRQTRVGQGGRLFTMYKLRTMRLDTDPYSVAPTDEGDPRVTRFGRWLRKLSLDEFPQLYNVLVGDMSMVGPRPEMPFIVEQYEDWQRRRLEVKPGITGLWQIVGRKNLPLALNLEYDFYYIKNQSLLFDIVILIRTVPAVLFGRGAF